MYTDLDESTPTIYGIDVSVGGESNELNSSLNSSCFSSSTLCNYVQ